MHYKQKSPVKPISNPRQVRLHQLFEFTQFSVSTTQEVSTVPIPISKPSRSSWNYATLA